VKPGWPLQRAKLYHARPVNRLWALPKTPAHGMSDPVYQGSGQAVMYPDKATLGGHGVTPGPYRVRLRALIIIMDDLSRRYDHQAITQPANAATQIGILIVQEETGIELADMLDDMPRCRQAGAGEHGCVHRSLSPPEPNSRSKPPHLPPQAEPRRDPTHSPVQQKQ
jgi:hypothetical protein